MQNHCREASIFYQARSQIIHVDPATGKIWKHCSRTMQLDVSVKPMVVVNKLYSARDTVYRAFEETR
jgi:hypothetical protein